MISTALVLLFLTISIVVHGNEYYNYVPYVNMSRATKSGMHAYRSALTLDWMAEDKRQRQMVAAFETEQPAHTRIITTECINYPRPSSGKVAKLMLELLKNLEGDDGVLVPKLIRVLVKSKLIVETSMLDAEPDLESLVKTPTMMMGEPHVTFPRILAIVWMLVTDATTTKTNGWCPINKVNEYLATTKPTEIAKHMRMLEPVLARARYIMEEFIQRITPLNIYARKSANLKPQRNEKDDLMDEPPMGEYETLTPPPKENVRARNDDQDQLVTLPTLETEYASTQLLEQAQQLQRDEKEDLMNEPPMGEYETPTPPTKEKMRARNEDQDQLVTLPTLETVYASTQLLEQAQQVAKFFEDLETVGKADRLKETVKMLSFLMYILFMLF